MTVTRILELVARMRRDAFSRNRNFEAFASADADGARARRLWRFLRSLERDLEAARAEATSPIRLSVHPHGEDGRRLVIEVPALRLRRVAVLSAEEYRLLREHPEARDALDRAEAAND